MNIRTILLGLLLVSPTLAADTDGPVTSTVFAAGKEGYHTFRIPAAIVTPRGTLLAFCEGRKTGRSDHGDLDLVLKRSRDGGKTWGPLEMVYEEGGGAKITIGNPCPVIDRSTGTLWLPFCRNNKQVLMTSSRDDGKTWAKPVEISNSVTRPEWAWVATGPGVGIQLQHGKYKGRLVIPCDQGVVSNGRRIMYSHVFYSDDHGKTWVLGGRLDKHTDECQVIERTDGTLLMNARNYWGRAGGKPERGNMRVSSISRDGGKTWSALTFEETLIEPICQGSLLSYVKPGGVPGREVLFSNPASRKGRVKLTVRYSRDQGRSWSVSRLVHPGPSAYSCLTVLPDGSIGCLYEGGTRTAYEQIRFVRFTRQWLTAAAGR